MQIVAVVVLPRLPFKISEATFRRFQWLSPRFSLTFNRFHSEERQKPQPPLLLKKVSQYTSHLYCNTPPICIAVLLVPLGSKEREKCQYSSHLYRSTPPICIAIRLPFVSQYFWENLGGCGHRDVPHSFDLQSLFLPVCFSQFESVRLNRKRRNSLTTRRWGKRTLK